MLPDSADDKVTQAGTMPSKTYKMLIDDDHVHGHITDKLQAVEQACYKVINTERYKYLIYSWDYGIELEDLFDKPIPYCYAEIPRRIQEALTQDDRVIDVVDFDLNSDKRGNVSAKFTVKTIYGDIHMQKEVKI